MPYKDRETRRDYHHRYNKGHYQRNAERRREEVKQRRRSIKRRFEDYKRTLSCAVCGFSGADCPWAIEFDHLDAETKSCSVSHLVTSGYSWDRIMEEVAKCEPLCSNHHRIRERERYLMRKAKTGDSQPAPRTDPEYQKQRRINRRNRRQEGARVKEESTRVWRDEEE